VSEDGSGFVALLVEDVWVAMPNVDVAYDEDMALCGLLFKHMLSSALGFLTARPFFNLLYTITVTTSWMCAAIVIFKTTTGVNVNLSIGLASHCVVYRSVT